MKKLRIIKPKIRNKLLFGFIFVSLLVGIVSYVSINNVRDIRHSYDNISTNTLPLIKYLGEMKFESLRLVSSSSEYGYIQTERQIYLKILL